MNRINAGLECPYCGADSEVIDSAEIYSESYGILYICRPCQAWVGAHKETGDALGRLANAELREWKKKAHNIFDRLWKKDGSEKPIMTRRYAYQWMAQHLQINPLTAHIGMFDIDKCQQLIELCNREFPPAPIIISFS